MPPDLLILFLKIYTVYSKTQQFHASTYMPEKVCVYIYIYKKNMKKDVSAALMTIIVEKYKQSKCLRWLSI